MMGACDVALHNEHGPVVTWLRAVGPSEIGPPDLAAFNYHGSGGSALLCKRLTAGGNRASSVP